MYGLPDSWAGGIAQRVVSNKGNSRKIPIADSDNMEGWLELFMYWRAQRQAKKQAKIAPLPRETASAEFTPREEKEKKVRFIVKEDK